MTIPAFLQPRLRIFISADVIGSTALKQSKLGALVEYTRQGENGPGWFSAIQGFYFEAAQAFIGEWQRRSKESELPGALYGSAPTVWKTVGDEVVFVKEITDHRQIVTTLQTWLAALPRIRQFLENENANLGVKSTSWIAGFPFRNREVVVDHKIDVENEEEDYYSANGRRLNEYYADEENGIRSSIIIDFVGPSIDTGFRLCQFCSERKLIVSIDIAYIISMTQFDGEVDRTDLYFDGTANLKGVLGGHHYPIFWIDVSDENSLFRKEDKLKAIHALDKEDLKEYCDAFYAEHEGYIFRPFIDGDVGGVWSKKPNWYQEYQQILWANFEGKADQRYEVGPLEKAVEGMALSEERKRALLKKIQEAKKARDGA